MKKMMTWVTSGVAMALLLACNGSAQQSTPPPATDYTPAAPGATSSSPTSQVGTAPTTSTATNPGIPLPADAQNDAQLGSANGTQPRAGAATGGTTNDFPAPTNQSLDFNHRGGAFDGQRDLQNSDGGRAELGVWLVESGGPGVAIRRITEGSAADLAGLQSGDVILKINGRGAASPHGVAQMIREMPAGQTAMVEYWRDGQPNELEIVLQAARDHRVGFRGEDTLTEMNQAGGDMESRTMRLEQQLAMVMQELQQLRQDMAQIRSGAGGATSAGGSSFDNSSTTSGFGNRDSSTGAEATGSAIQPGQPGTDATTPNNSFDDSSTEPAVAPLTEPGAEPSEPPAAPSNEAADEDDDLFGGTSTEEPAATEAEAATTEPAAAEDDSAAPEEEPTTSESDDLF